MAATVAIGNGGPPPSTTNPVPAAAVTTGVFGGSGATTFPGNVIASLFNGIPQGLQGAPATSPGFYCGVGVPTISAANGSMYLRFDGVSGSLWYCNESGASTVGTTWTALAAP